MPAPGPAIAQGPPSSRIYDVLRYGLFGIDLSFQPTRCQLCGIGGFLGVLHRLLFGPDCVLLGLNLLLEVFDLLKSKDIKLTKANENSKQQTDLLVLVLDHELQVQQFIAKVLRWSLKAIREVEVHCAGWSGERACTIALGRFQILTAHRVPERNR